MTVNQFLEKDEKNSDFILKLGIAKKSFADLSSYAGICGSLFDGVLQWADHNIYDLDEVENHKYRGYIVTDSMGIKSRFVIPKWVLSKDVSNDWKYAKNMFCKFLRKV